MDSFKIPVPLVTAREAREMSDASDAAFNRLMAKIDADIRKFAALGDRELSIPTTIQGRETESYPELCPWHAEKPTSIQNKLITALVSAGFGVKPPIDKTTRLVIRW